MAFITLSGKRAKRKSAALFPSPVSHNVLCVELSYLAAAVILILVTDFYIISICENTSGKKENITHSPQRLDSQPETIPKLVLGGKNGCVRLFKVKLIKYFLQSPFIFEQLPSRTVVSGANKDFIFISFNHLRKTPGDRFVLLVLEKIYEPH